MFIYYDLDNEVFKTCIQTISLLSTTTIDVLNNSIYYWWIINAYKNT